MCLAFESKMQARTKQKHTLAYAPGTSKPPLLAPRPTTATNNIPPTTPATAATNNIAGVPNVQCGVNQYRNGSAPGKCYTCSNIVCPNGQPHTGICGGTTDGWVCTGTAGTSTNTSASTLPPPRPQGPGTAETRTKATNTPPSTQGAHILLCMFHAGTAVDQCPLRIPKIEVHARTLCD